MKETSLAANLADWTRLSTAAVVQSCAKMSWRAAGRGHLLDVLPKAGQEYLAIDVMAFAANPAPEPATPRWLLPVAVFELENSQRDDRVAYSLWKTLCVRANLRVVFAYRPDWEQARGLIDALTGDVIGGLSPAERMQLGGETAIVTGSRGEGETFPYGYFKFWRLDANLGRFEKT